MAAIKGSVSSIPAVGGLLSELIDLAQTNIANKRFEQWRDMIEKELRRLNEVKSITIEDLSKNELFVACLQVATAGAMRAHEREKRQRFANALFSAASDDTIDNDKKINFISLLNDYTTSHIRILDYYSRDHDEPAIETPSRNLFRTATSPTSESPMKGIAENLPVFSKDPAFVQNITRRLVLDGLVDDVDLYKPVSKEVARGRKTTDYGDEFLKFIQNPDESSVDE